MKLLGINDNNENPNGTCLQDFEKDHYYLENVLSAFLLIVHAYYGPDGSISDKEASSKVEGGVSCTLEAQSCTDHIIFKLFDGRNSLLRLMDLKRKFLMFNGVVQSLECVCISYIYGLL